MINSCVGASCSAARWQRNKIELPLLQAQQSLAEVRAELEQSQLRACELEASLKDQVCASSSNFLLSVYLSIPISI